MYSLIMDQKRDYMHNSRGELVHQSRISEFEGITLYNFVETSGKYDEDGITNEEKIAADDALSEGEGDAELIKQIKGIPDKVVAGGKIPDAPPQSGDTSSVPP